MFRTKIRLIDEDWNLIHEYKSRMKPSVDEYIYIEPKYFKVLAVIHARHILTNNKGLTVVVKEWQNIIKK